MTLYVLGRLGLDQEKLRELVVGLGEVVANGDKMGKEAVGGTRSHVVGAEGIGFGQHVAKHVKEMVSQIVNTAT